MRVDDGVFVAGAAQTVAHLDAGRAIKSILQVVTDNPEVWQSHPARPHRTRAGHAVAFALPPHLRLDMLRC